MSSRVVLIDGHSASGKSTIADIMAEKLKCSVIHGDEFLYNAILKMPDELKEVFGRYPDYEKAGFGCIFFEDQPRTIKEERGLFEVTRSEVEKQFESAVEQQTADIAILEYITSNKFSRLWQNADHRIMVKSNPKLREQILMRRLKEEKYTTQIDMTSIREKAFDPLLANAENVDFNIENFYDEKIHSRVAEVCRAIIY
jgi:dephospho-CoA kinase